MVVDFGRMIDFTKDDAANDPENSLDFDFPSECIRDLLLCASLEDRRLTLGSCVHVCFLKILLEKSNLES